MDDSEQQALSAQLATLRADYLLRLSAELNMLQSLAAGLVHGKEDRARLETLHRQLHKVSGSGGIFGLHALSAASRRLEQRVQGWLSQDLKGVDATAFRMLSADLSALDSTIEYTELPPGRLPEPGPAGLADSTIRVWLVEEDAELTEQLKSQLEAFNYEVRVFRQIDEAGSAVQTDQPDLLIMDVMPDLQGEGSIEGMDCHPVLQTLKCPVLFISSVNDFKLRLLAARSGAIGYLLKPINIPTLVNRMEQYFNQLRAPAQKVLIVDDDADLATHMSLVLQASGMDAQVLSQPETIMTSLTAFQPDLVLMDIHMPGYTGPELAAVIRQHDQWASLPIVYLSAETDLERQIAAMSRGGDDFLSKPISDAQLVMAVRVRVARARQLSEQINKDSLTGLLKHSSIKELVVNEIRRAQRARKPVTLAMIDIDHFKQVNDSHGHTAGDVVISAMATLLRQRLRQSDPIGRYGGEEFLIVLPDCTETDAQSKLDDIRRRFADLRFSHEGKNFSCTLSAGYVTLHHGDAQDGDDTDDAGLNDPGLVVAAADAALYEAKRSGRNRLCAANPLHC